MSLTSSYPGRSWWNLWVLFMKNGTGVTCFPSHWMKYFAAFSKKTCWTFCSIFLPQMSIFQRDGSPQCHQTWLGRSLWSSHGGLVRWEKHRSKWEIFHCHVWFPEGILLIKHGYLASWGIPERFLFWTDIEQNGSNIFCLINSPPLVASW